MTQAFTSGAVSAACVAVRPNGMEKPSDSPPPAAAALARNERRLTAGAVIVIMARLLCLRRHVDRLAHLLISAAATDIRDGALDVGVARPRRTGRPGSRPGEEPSAG